MPPSSRRRTAACAPTFCTRSTGALRRTYSLLRARGTEPRQYKAWVIGGGNIFPGRYERSHVGDYNALWVLAALADDGVRVLWQGVGGNDRCRVCWTLGDSEPDVVAVAVEVAL